MLANSCQQAENIEKSDGASAPPKLRLEEKMPLTHLGLTIVMNYLLSAVSAVETFSSLICFPNTLARIIFGINRASTIINRMR